MAVVSFSGMLLLAGKEHRIYLLARADNTYWELDVPSVMENEADALVGKDVVVQGNAAWSGEFWLSRVEVTSIVLKKE